MSLPQHTYTLEMVLGFANAMQGYISAIHSYLKRMLCEDMALVGWLLH